MIRTTMTIATLVAFAALAGCHDGTSAGATAADTSITKAPDAAEIQAALSAQVADDYCWSQTDNAHPTWPAPLNPTQFHRHSRIVLKVLENDGLIDDTGSAVRPTEKGETDMSSWWDAKRGACLGTASVDRVTSVRVNHGSLIAPAGSLNVVFDQTLSDYPAWLKSVFKDDPLLISDRTVMHVTLLKDDQAPGGWRRAGVLVKDASQPTGWREDKFGGT